MSGKRQPTAVVVAKGKKHFTKAEIAARVNAEVAAATDNIVPPAYLSAKQKRTFREISAELLEVGLISNLDCDALARLIIAQDHYREVTRQLKRTPLMLKAWRETGRRDAEGKPETEEHEIVNQAHYDLANLQQKFFTECRQGASDFGLTVSSRCRLVIPHAEEKKSNKFIDGFLRGDDLDGGEGYGGA